MTTGLLRDRLLVRLAEMGSTPDYVQLAREVLAIRNAPEALARRLVMQALVIEDRQEHWQRVGEAACAQAPESPAVYLFLDADRRLLYVGKALRLRRRLRAHFAPRRWRSLNADMARVAKVEWHLVGSELEALLIEAQWIGDLSPQVNVQRSIGEVDIFGEESARTVVLLPSASAAHVVIVAVAAGGAVLMHEAARDGSDVRAAALALQQLFAAELPAETARTARHGAIVHRWLKQRGAHTTRLDPADCATATDWERALDRALSARELFRERLVFR